MVPAVLSMPFTNSSTQCDFSQVTSNSNYGKTGCDTNFGGDFAVTLPCGNADLGYPECNTVRNQMMGCEKTFAPHANCKFGDSFIGKIGCQYEGGKLLPPDKQPVTCTEDTTWCCPCGYDNDGAAKRTCGLYRSDPRPWSSLYTEENLLPDDFMKMTVDDVKAMGWYTTDQDYMWCNVGGKCFEICQDGHDCTKGGCGAVNDPAQTC